MSLDSEYGGDLVLLQPTPFCNINCDYCYLGGRLERSRMSFETLRKALELVREAGAARSHYCLVWHVGEPLVLPVDWYREAHQICSEVLGASVEFHYQTNGTLISADWIELMRSDPRIKFGVSVDGPRFLHDAHRRTRAGTGTHDRVMKGVSLLKEAGIPFDCIAVVTGAALDHPDEFYDFFEELGPRMLSMNPESIDGVHDGTSVRGSNEVRYRRFLRRIADLHLGRRGFIIRNFLWAELKVQALSEAKPGVDCVDGNRLNRPWQILSFDWKGNVHTFSPSLLGTDIPGAGKNLGNVWTHSYADLASSAPLVSLQQRIADGVQRCRKECSHFAHCGGGSPAHKWFEHRSFGATETTYCRLGVQANWEEYLAAAEEYVLQ